MSDAPGWYGKLPTLGDFASRRLDAAWVTAWDGWLAQEIDRFRAARGDAWLEAYLASPVWRFVLAADVLAPGLPATPMAGVLMPSVDRVGRYFPLTIAAPLAGLPLDGPALQAVLAWLHRLDDTAVDALNDDWDIERLEAELASLAPPAVAPATPLRPGQLQVLAGAHQLAARLGAGLAGRALDDLGACSLWFAQSAEGPVWQLLEAGLPRGERFDALMLPPAAASGDNAGALSSSSDPAAATPA